MESIHGPKVRARFGDRPLFRDTPDILIYLDDPKSLVAIEAKMYDVPDGAALVEQMERQRQYILDYLAERLSIAESSVYHRLLIPEGLLKMVAPLPLPVTTWEELYKEFTHDRVEDYFLCTLRLALENYDELAAKRSAFKANAEAVLLGRKIYEGYKQASLPYTFMGRKLGGLGGQPLQEDVESGSWEKQNYEVNSRDEPSNPNWFPIKSFVDLIDSNPSS